MRAGIGGRDRAQIRHGHRARLARVACHPPSPQRVVQQKVHHVGFGEKLGHSRQFISTYLDFRRIDLVFTLGLPELINPAQAVAGMKDFGRQLRQQQL